MEYGLLVLVAFLAVLFFLVRDYGRAIRGESVVASANRTLASPRVVNARSAIHVYVAGYIHWRGFASADIVGRKEEGLLLRETGNRNARSFFRPWEKIFAVGESFADVYPW